MPKADLHIHTRVSDGLATVEQTIDHIERETDLDVVAITDHEDATGGQRAREYAARRGYRVEVVVGAEITTRQGHLLALFIDEAPKSFRSIGATIEAIHRQGGLAVVPHPMSWLTRSLSRRTMERVMALADPTERFDAIELANPSPAGKLTQRAAVLANRTWRLPVIGASDAHHLPHVGAGWTEFDQPGALGLRDDLVNGGTRARMRNYPGVREVGLRQLALGLAWGYAATPRKMIRPLFGGRR